MSEKPNVLLIVDSSGSMEYKTGEDTYPTCNPGMSASVNERSRWIDVIEVLTGSITDYSCESVDRDSATFKAEFAMPGGSPEPPDSDYRNPYHRPLSFGCAKTPDRSAAPANAFSWVEPLEAPYPVNPGALGSCSASFQQAGNGFIDAYSDLVRFGLMTFDTETDTGTGYNSTTFAPEYNTGVPGAWSYFGTVAAAGKPANCSTLQPMEVGVRNGAAPASEGKMIHFGDPNATLVIDRDRHTRIEQVLLATRPYGATPLNGALDDARYYFWDDANDDPTDITRKFSPHYDEFVDCGCRQQHVILITDGEPNLDLRPDCEEAGSMGGEDGVCPFPDTPAEILANLDDQLPPDMPVPGCGTGFTNKYNIRTHVVGYSTATYAGGTADCDDLRTDVADWNVNGGTCDTTTDADLRICCKLHELAAAGSTRTGGDQKPYLAPDAATLQQQLGDIIKQTIGNQASATQPVMSPGVGVAESANATVGEPVMVAFRLLTSFEVAQGTEDGLWRANLERQRWVCESGVPTPQPADESKGDDFAANVASAPASREFLTFVPDVIGLGIHPERTIRPHLAADNDGLGNTGGNEEKGEGSAFTARVPPEAMDIDLADGQCDGALSVTACRNRILNWTLGFSDGDVPPNNRCESSGDADCSVIGDILHSTPVIVNRPSAPVEDETYAVFASQKQGRMMMAYTSSNDGMLHGFAASPNEVDATQPKVDSLANNERFAFIPPMLLPLLKSQYPDTRMKLLDSQSVVQDVVATGTTFPYRLERTASATEEAANTWRTILVQSFGGELAGYFALDITDVEKPSTGNGPKFLWQITTTDTPDQLFGKNGVPLITTLNIQGKEVAVAVLPGGQGGSPTGTCPRNGEVSNGDFSESHHKNSAVSDSYGDPRSDVQCYSASELASRSLTIVRLDDGEIIRTFRNDAAEVTGLNSTVVTAAELDSPLSGAPAAFPAGTGMIADRIFIGDQDGTMWRADVSSSDPANWEMNLFFDAYNGRSATAGKPLVIPPVLSINDDGRIVVAIATGSQDLAGSTGDLNFVYSLTEAEDAMNNEFYTKVNWFQELNDGEHVLGPMSLVSGVLYFSTVSPSDGGDACNPAPSRIWGMDYFQPEGSATDGNGGLAGLTLEGSTPEQYVDAVDLGVSGSIFGVSVDFQPSCSNATPGDASYLAGSRTQVNDPSASKLALSFNTVGGTGDSAGFKTGFKVVALAQPPTASSILSWAAILE